MRANSRPFWFWAIPVNILVIALIAIFILVIDEDRAPVAESQPAGQGASSHRDPTASGAANGAGGSQGGAGAPSGPQPGVATREPESPFGLGFPKAPVAMVVFTDYQCPFCAKYAHDTEQKLIEDYVNTSKLRIEWRDVDFFGDASNLAARAAWAAGQQNQYVEFHHALFKTGEPLKPEDLTQEKLSAAARSLSMDVARFEKDLGSDQAYQHVRDNADEAAAAGAFNTPAFIINGAPLSGAQPIDEFRRAIEKAEKDNPYTGGGS